MHGLFSLNKMELSLPKLLNELTYFITKLTIYCNPWPKKIDMTATL